MNEQKLFQLLKAKEDNSFRGFFYHYHDFFYRIAFYYLRNEEDAQEVALNAFMKLWRLSEESIDAIKSLNNYCFVLVKNESLNFLSANRYGFDALEEQHITAISQATPESEILQEELLQVYVEAVEQLPPKCKEVYIHIKEKNKTYAEVAEEMGISLKTVDNHLQKSVRIIKEKVNRYFSDAE